MKKTIVLSALVGMIGFLITFLSNFGHNLLGTSLIRGFYAFVIWFVLACLLRWVLGFIMKPSDSVEPAAPDADSQEGLGNQLDISTPGEDQELIDLLKPKPAEGGGNAEGFQPLQPPKLVSMKDPEELAKAVRHLKEE
ncbi:hypothetical protein [Paenibacillus tengchongensis]|uniref:hypothetical protein n=1 Tax=Paenibacillus tengchongensis TaxID=2608684 RepID=UPI001FEA5E1B|nr:hypothetical protein [Paenibacillus tengchongensis]